MRLLKEVDSTTRPFFLMELSSGIKTGEGGGEEGHWVVAQRGHRHTLMPVHDPPAQTRPASTQDR